MKVWECLESSRGLVRVPALWRETLGENFERFRAAFLQQRKEPATSYPCPRACGCAHAIHSIGNGKALAVCQCEDGHCADIELGAEDIVLLELSWNKLARALCAGLSLDWKPADLGIPNARQIGSWSADAVPAILTIQADACTFQSALLEMIARLRSRFILIAPTARHVNAITRELLTSTKAALISLDTSVRLSAGGVIDPILRPGELFAEFSPGAGDKSAEDAQRLFGMIRQLEGRSKRQNPPLLQIFRMYFMEDRSPEDISIKLGCSRATIFNRVKAIEKATGTPAAALKRMSSHFSKVQEEMSRHGARHIHGRKMIYDADDDAND